MLTALFIMAIALHSCDEALRKKRHRSLCCKLQGRGPSQSKSPVLLGLTASVMVAHVDGQAEQFGLAWRFYGMERTKVKGTMLVPDTIVL